MKNEVMKNEWVSRPDLNWCYFCWFGANIESIERETHTNFLCRNCGAHFTKTKPELLEKIQAMKSPLIGLFDQEDIELPKHFTDEEWQKYWEQHFKKED